MFSYNTAHERGSRKRGVDAAYSIAKPLGLAAVRVVQPVVGRWSDVPEGSTLRSSELSCAEGFAL
jgi:hypothetical protein